MDYKKLIELGLNKGLQDIEIMENISEKLSIRMFQKEVNKYNLSKLKTLNIRAIYNNKLTSLSLENQDVCDMNEVIDTLISNATILNSKENVLFYDKNENYKIDDLFDFNKISYDEKVKLLNNYSNCCYNYSDLITSVTVSYSEEKESIHLINSKGLDKKKTVSYGVCVVQVVCKKDEFVNNSYKIDIVKDFHKFKKDLAIEACKEALSKLGSTSIKSDEYNVILKNEAVTSLLQAFSGLFSGENAIKKLTPLNDKIGEKIFGDNITLIDDPLQDKLFYPLYFDDEGVPTSTKNIIENGVLKTMLHNLKTASYFNTSSTGNGIKKGSNISVEAINLSLKPGIISLDELLKKVDNGIYITDLSGLHAGVNMVSGDFSLQSEGYLIKDGKLDKPVSLIVLSGNFYDLFNNVKELANDFKYDSSGFGSSSIYVGKMKISGN